LTNTIGTLTLNGDEVLVVPKNMADKVKRLRIPIRVSDDEYVDSGFLIKGKGIMLNYTFDSLIDYYREELETEIAQSLFKE